MILIRNCPQSDQEIDWIDLVLKACILDRVKCRDLAAYAPHSEILKDADRGGPSGHNVIDNHVRRGCDLFHRRSLKQRLQFSLL